MENNFLFQLAKQIHSENYNLENLWVVLPSKRAGTFLKKSLAKCIGDDFICPDIISVTDLITRLNPVKKMEPLKALFILYKHYQDLHKKTKSNEVLTFDGFLSWAPTLLSDFGDIDRYLVDTKDYFNYINDVKAIELWNLDGQPLTESELAFIAFWKNIGELYHSFQKECVANGILTDSQLYKNTAENIKNLIDFLTKEISIVIAGLNVLTPSEQKIIDELIKSKRAKIYWDLDQYYLKQNIQEAGKFLRSNIAKWGKPDVKWMHDSFLSETKNIRIHECNTKYGQVKAIAELLDKELDKENQIKSAVVLNEEDLLIPLLYALPNKVQSANITMGYELQNTPLASLIFSVVELWRKMKGEEDANNVFYYKDVFQVIDHPYAEILFQTKESILKIRRDVIKNNKVYLGRGFLTKYFGEDNVEVCFPLKKTIVGKGIIQQLLKILDILKRNVEKEIDEDTDKSLKIEYIYHYTIALRKLLNVVDEFGVDFNVQSAKSLINQVINKEKISFFGEPLAGLQIMGMLETRALDFEHIILVSTNEGVLPQGKKNNSFFPFDIAKLFGLPTHQEKDAVFAYYFYRLIQKAKKVDLFYYTSSDDFGAAGEKSRFVEQVIRELPSYNDKTKISYQSYAPLPSINANELVIKKDVELKYKAIAYFQKGMSPSAINTYLRCGKDFYYKYLLGLREQDEFEENMGSSSFGTAIHNTLEELYKPLVGNQLKVEHVELFEKSYLKELKKQFTIILSDNNFEKGFNRVQFEVASGYIKQYFFHEKKYLAGLNEPYVIQYIEKDLKQMIEVEVEGELVEVVLFGKADRIGKVGDVYHVVDYKSGSVKSTDLNIKNFDDLKSDKKSKALQLLLYSYLVIREFPEIENIEANIFSLKNQSEGYMPFKINNNKNIDRLTYLNETPLLIQSICRDILDKSIDITHNEKSMYCEYC